MINFPFDPTRTPQAQIETAIASVLPCPCAKHPHELRPVNQCATVLGALRADDDRPFDSSPFAVAFTATYADVTGRPLRPHFERQRLAADQIPQERFAAWLAAIEAQYRSEFGNRAPRLLGTRLQSPFESWTIVPQFARCLQCSLERLGIAPDEARASFDGFTVDPAALRRHLETCRAFAAAPAGVLLLLGNCGTGKTHLAIAILRERLRRGASGLVWVKHRHFLADHWHAMRPVAFRTTAPESPLARCQAASLLVYDELTVATDSRTSEDVLVDLFEPRIGSYKPSIITANLSPGELEAALGSRLYDRLRRAAFAVLEFGFESKRRVLNADYLRRGRAQQL